MIEHSAIVLIPAYNPTASLVGFVKELYELKEVEEVIVVNDGSTEQSRQVFAELQEDPRQVIIDHAVNLGKGAALKSGLNYILTKYPSCQHIVTADADGQHLVDDIRRLVVMHFDFPNTLLLGVRDFAGDVPFRSKFGNVVTRWILYLVSGLKLADTQTGLRAIPRKFAYDVLRLKTMNYDFELDMLLHARKAGFDIQTIPITTVYIEHNASSHFNPLLDSAKIYFVFLRFILSSLTTAVSSLAAYSLLHYFFQNPILSEVGFWIVGLLVQFSINKNFVFHATDRKFITLLRFAILVGFVAFLSYALTIRLHEWFDIGFVASRVICAVLLYIPNFIIQREVVFKA